MIAQKMAVMPKIKIQKGEHYSMNHKSTSARKRVMHKNDISLNECTNFVSIDQSMMSQCQLQNMLSKAVCTTSPTGVDKNKWFAL